MSEFSSQFTSFLKNNQTVLDLGAGSGRQALIMADRGCKVWAIDKNHGKVHHDLIFWEAIPIEKWLQKPAETIFDAILMNNIIFI